MTQVEAVFENGMLRPLSDLRLREHQRVRLNIESIEADDERAAWQACLERLRRHREEMIARVGVLPDSTPDIAADRMRDV